MTPYQRVDWTALAIFVVIATTAGLFLAAGDVPVLVCLIPAIGPAIFVFLGLAAGFAPIRRKQ